MWLTSFSSLPPSLGPEGPSFDCHACSACRLYCAVWGTACTDGLARGSGDYGQTTPSNNAHKTDTVLPLIAVPGLSNVSEGSEAANDADTSAMHGGAGAGVGV